MIPAKHTTTEFLLVAPGAISLFVINAMKMNSQSVKNVPVMVSDMFEF